VASIGGEPGQAAPIRKEEEDASKGRDGGGTDMPKLGGDKAYIDDKKGTIDLVISVKESMS